MKYKFCDFVKKYEQFYSLGIFILGVLCLTLSVLKFANVMSILFQLSFVFIAVWTIIKFAVSIIDERRDGKWSIASYVHSNALFISLIILAFLALISVFATSNFNIGSFSYFNQFLCLFFCFALYVLIVDIKFNDVSKHIFFTSIIVTSVLVIILFFSGYARTWNAPTEWVDLTLNLVNPNLTGEYVFVYILLLLGAVFYSKSKIIKILAALCLPFEIMFLFLTRSRNSWIAFAVACVLVLVLFFTRIKMKLKTKALFLVLVPIFYIFVTMLLGYISDLTGLFTDLLMELSITARYYSIADALSHFVGNIVYILFGNYAISGAIGTIDNLGGAYIMVLVLFGSIPFIVFVYMLYKILFTKINTSISRTGRTPIFPIICFLSILYFSFNEGGVFVGSAGFYILGIFASMIFFHMFEEYSEIRTSQIVKNDLEI